MLHWPFVQVRYLTSTSDSAENQIYRRRGIGTHLYRSVIQHRFTEERQLYVAYGEQYASVLLHQADLRTVDLLSCNIAANKAIKAWKFQHGGTIPGIARQQGRAYDQHFYSAFISQPPDISQIAFPAKLPESESETSGNEVKDPDDDDPVTTIRDAVQIDIPTSEPYSILQ